MRVIHRIKFHANANSAHLNILDELELPYELPVQRASTGASNDVAHVAFEIAEDHPKWPRVKALAFELKWGDLIRTEFDHDELTHSQFLALIGVWYHGYPMPDKDFGFLGSTYGGTGCQRCGVGRSQTAPFRMRAEPKWGKMQVMQLNWIIGEFFVKAETYDHVFKPYGIPCTEVLHNKTGQHLETVVQLCVPHSRSNLKITEFDEVCEYCGAGKYHWPTRGFFPPLVPCEASPIFKTCEWFGSGGAAGRITIISQELYQSIQRFALNGCDVQPLANWTP